MTERDPMEENIIHWLLVTSNRMQSIPALLITGAFILLALLIAALWRGESSTLAALSYGGVAFGNWLSLWLLPRLGRSYGPDRPSALALGLVNALIFAVIGLLALPWWAALVIGLLITAAAFYATWIEPFRLGVTHERRKAVDWDEHTQPVRLLHIGDVHIERITARERQLNALIKDLAPDVIVFSGDFVNISYNDDPIAKDHIRQIIRQWEAPLGVYCVPGTYTVEPIERVREFTKGLENLRLLEDEWVMLDTPNGQLNILGMVTTHYVDRDRETLKRLKQTGPAEGANVLLTHAPDVAPEADALGFDLYLCGHTHGGQLRFPLIGAVFSGSALGMQFVMGRYDLQNLTVYTSRGVGLEGMGAPRARFLCPPEVILWEIT